VRTSRHVASLLLALTALDLLVVLVTGKATLLAPFGLGPGGDAGFVVRAGLLGLFLLLRFRILADPLDRPSGARLLLVLLLLPTLVQFHVAGGRLGGDGISYYVFVRSLAKDGDVDLTNEYAHYGLLDRSDLKVETKTGLRRSIFSIGPALVWLPFFFLGEGIGRAQLGLGGAPDLTGYGPLHVNAVALGSVFYGFATVWLVHDLLRRHFAPGTALGAALLTWGATFLPWYMVQQPTMSHAPSAFGAALTVWLWDRGREGRGFLGYALLGLVLGLAMCLRWQNGVLLALPGLELLERWRGGSASLAGLAGRGAALFGGTLLGALPQMLVWKALYGVFLLEAPPHGADFLRLDHPFALETLFSSRHGLLSWTPVFWAGYLGFLPLFKRHPRLALPLAVPLVLMTYVNMCSGDWWAGGSFSNRRFDSLLPVFAFGFAASIDVLRATLVRRPGIVLGALAAAFVVWNVLLAEEVRRGLVPRDDTVAFPRLAGHAAQILSDAVGFPTTWPASWLFAWRERRPPGQYDRLVGRYLFYRQKNLGGHIEIGVPEDEAMLGEGWGGIESADGRGWRRVLGEARVMAPLDVPEPIEVAFQASADASREVSLLVNGRRAGRALVDADWKEHRVAVPASFWRRERNDVVLRIEHDGAAVVRVDAFDFTRLEAEPGTERGFRER
jgi:hypothetical protein